MLSPTNATVLASYNCSAACVDCCFGSHPGIKQRLSLDQIKHFIFQASCFPTMRLIVFSGGECFLLGPDLDTSVAYATSLGLNTRCVSNGYWAATTEKARSRLRNLVDSGLKELNISTGDFHQQFVPEENIINAVEASLYFGLRTIVVVEVQKQRRVTGDTIRQNSRVAAVCNNPKLAPNFKIVESPWMPQSHNAFIPQAESVLLNSSNVHRRKGCESILSTLVATPVPERLGICCGLCREQIPELNLEWSEGETLASLYQRCTSDFIKIWLSVEGPERILAWAASKDPEIRWENLYAHRCHACLAVFKSDRVINAIKAHYRERVDDVLLKYAIISRGYDQLLKQSEEKPEVTNVDNSGFVDTDVVKDIEPAI